MEKILNWIKMGLNEWKWVEQVGLDQLFDVHWTTPSVELLEEFLHTLEPIEDGKISTKVQGKKFTIDQVLIWE